MDRGFISNIQHFSVHDGPGVRTTVFFKGCNLRCPWCHNPECGSGEMQVQFFAAKCILCRSCEPVCHLNLHTFNGNSHLFDRQKCLACGRCSEVCPTEALKISGRACGVEEIVREVCEDIDFYKTSGGGVTFSGGEPLLQPDFLTQLLKACQEQGIHTAVETALDVSDDKIKRILPFTNLVITDIKHMDNTVMARITGGCNQRIHDNMRRICNEGISLAVRIPIIPDFNDTEDNLIQSALFIRELSKAIKVEILPFHHYATGKYESLGLSYAYADRVPPSPETMQSICCLISSFGLDCRII